ncbi:MAG: aspartyl protease family protein [Thermoplasmata archaeon]
MGRVELVFDPGNSQFSVAVFIPLPTGPYVGTAPGAEKSLFVNAEFLVDTGSNSSALNEALAVDLGIEVESLPRLPSTGINGVTLEPYYPGDLTLYLNESLEKTTIEQPSVYHPAAKKVKQKIGGRVVRRGIAEARMPNLFGLDALKAINGTGGKLVVDMRSQTAYIEW